MKLKGLAALTTLVILAGCRGDAPREPEDQPAAEADTVEKPAVPPGGVLGDTVGPGFQVRAAVTDSTITVTPAEVRPGEITLTVANAGTERHVIEVTAEHGGRWRTFPAAPGSSVSLNTTWTPGKYTIFDPDRKERLKAEFVVK